MKKLIVLLLTAVLVLSVCASAGAVTINPKTQTYPAATPANKENNPVIEGENPYTGLPWDLTNPTPMLVVTDNNAHSYWHYGAGSADIMFHVPNQAANNSKILMFFCSEYPKYAGGTRSARMTMLPFAAAFDCAFVSAGQSKAAGSNTSVAAFREKWNIIGEEKFFNLNNNNTYKSEQGSAQYNKMAHVQEIRDIMLSKNVNCELRPFLFTDEPLSRGEEAAEISIKCYTQEKQTNADSNCSFYYDEGLGYCREPAAGIELDPETGVELRFANVIVMRIDLDYQENDGTYYAYYNNQLTGGGKAEIFQSGRYIPGAWYREKETSRLIFLDDEGNELKLQRGKTFILVNTDNCAVSYE